MVELEASMLHEFVTENREEIISRCKAKTAARSAPSSRKAVPNHGVPMFLDELVDELRLGLSPNPEISKTAAKHGHDLLREGLSASQVVHGYGDVCQAITELALELNMPVSTDDFRMLNRCLDDAIAAAVTQYGNERDRSIDGEAAGETARLGRLAHELRTSIHTAGVALEAIKSGNVGIAGSTGKVLDRSLSGAHDLIDRLVVELNDTPRSTDRATVSG
jgi:hypothetical protein